MKAPLVLFVTLVIACLFVSTSTSLADRYNARPCVTPMFPAGTYARLVTIAADHTPACPDIIGRQNYRMKQGGNFGAVSTVGFTIVDSPILTFCHRGELTALDGQEFGKDGGRVTLTQSSVEGGRSTVGQNPGPPSGWSSADTIVSGGASFTQRIISAPGTNGFHRVRFDSVDVRDTIDTP